MYSSNRKLVQYFNITKYEAKKILALNHTSKQEHWQITSHLIEQTNPEHWVRGKSWEQSPVVKEEQEEETSGSCAVSVIGKEVAARMFQSTGLWLGWRWGKSGSKARGNVIANSTGRNTHEKPDSVRDGGWKADQVWSWETQRKVKSNQVVNKVGARNRSNQQQLTTITFIFLESLYGQKHGMVISFRPEDERCFWKAEHGGWDRSAFPSCSRRHATENLLIAMPEALDWASAVLQSQLYSKFQGRFWVSNAWFWWERPWPPQL